MQVFGLKRTARLLLGLSTILLAGCSGTPSDKDSPRAGNTSAPRGIVLITVDGWWDPSTKSSSIPSGFADLKVRLVNAMTPCPQVRPAVCAILTGKTPVESGVRVDVGTPLPASVPIVTERLTQPGWLTAAFVADPRVGRGSGLERGFQIFDAPKELLLGSFRHLPRVRNPGDVVANFSSWIASVPENASFLAWIHLSRPSITPPVAGGAEDVGTALAHLSDVLKTTSRLSGAAVMLIGTAGSIDLVDGPTSGYFLNEATLRVPVLVRSRSDRSATLDPQAPFTFVDATRWIEREAGLDTPSSGASAEATPRLAWTWRGEADFGWPAEVAAQQGSALCVRSLPDLDLGCAPWGPASAVGDADRRACLSSLATIASSSQAPRALPEIPAELKQRLDQLGLSPPAPRTGAPSAVARDARVSVVPSITRARRAANQRRAVDADAEYQKALAIDPKNFGALIEAGEALALEGRAKPAKARLEPAMRTAPWSPEAWHWLGHVSYLEKHLERAETQWRVSDVLEPGDGDVLYDLACARSLAGDPAGSLAYLRLAWQAGFRDVNAIQVDSDLRNLRADPSFVRFMREVVH